MPATARSASTKRTGTSVACARASRHAASSCAMARAAPRHCRASLMRHHATAGIARCRGPRQRGARTRPRPTPSRPRASRSAIRWSRIASRCSTSDGRVRALAVGQRAARPVRHAVALGQLHADDALDQAGERRRREAGEVGDDLRVEHAASAARRRPRGTLRGPDPPRAAPAARRFAAGRRAAPCRRPACRPARWCRPTAAGAAPRAGSRCARGETRCRRRRTAPRRRRGRRRRSRRRCRSTRTVERLPSTIGAR